MTMTATPHPQAPNPSAPPDVTGAVYVIGPALAETWLKRNTWNRRLDDARVKQYTRDMTAGRWMMTGEAITFDTDNAIVSGQHRLHAVVQSGATIQSFVVFGIPPESREVTDTGRPRSATDVLRMQGRDHASVLASTVSLAIQWARARVKNGVLSMPRGKDFNVTHSETLAFLAEHPDVVDAVEAALNFKIPGVSTSVRAFVLWRLRQIDRAAADQFMRDLSEGKGAGAGDPRSALRNRLATAAARRERLTRAQLVTLLFRTWNAIRTGRPYSRALARSRTGDVAVEEPV